jgi:deoxyinosine 3'endonuclease (endonuclease V)
MDADADDDRLRSLISSWNEEQHHIASRVVVPPDTSTTSSVIIESDGRDGGRFRLMHPPPPPSSTTTTTNDDAKNGTLLVGGVDVHYHDEGDHNMAVAVYVILRYDIDARTPPRVVHRSHKWYRPTVPYVPSYLAYRELDPLIELINDHHVDGSNLELVPSVIFVDGNGMWHERMAGLACFVGVKTGLPTAGVGKTFYSLDGVMTKQDVHRRVNDALYSWYDEMKMVYADRDDERIGKETSSVATNRFLVLDTAASNPATPFVGGKGLKAKLKQDVSVERILEMLHQFAYGIAIPMKKGCATDNYDNNNYYCSGNDEDETLAYALVGHGGNDVIRTSSKDSSTRARRGSINPIYISVGSDISLLDAVNLCSRLCVTRIPEPIREADLYCRRLVRERWLGL